MIAGFLLFWLWKLLQYCGKVSRTYQSFSHIFSFQNKQCSQFRFSVFGFGIFFFSLVLTCSLNKIVNPLELFINQMRINS